MSASQNPPPRVGVALLNWNGYADTARCLASLRRSEFRPARILVFDNGSEDGSAERLPAEFPEIDLVRSGENLGFAEGNNRAVQRLLAAGMEQIWILNNDTEVPPDCLGRLVAALAADPDIGAVSAKVWFMDPAKPLCYAGADCHPWTLQVTWRGIREPDRGQHDTAADVEVLTGCCMLVRAEVVRRIGLFNRAFFAYTEDIDWSLRARAAGIRLRYVPEATLWHKMFGASTADGERAIPKSSPQVEFLMARNHCLLARLHTRPGRLRRAVSMLYHIVWHGLPRAAVLLLLRDRRAAGTALLRGLWAGWRLHPDPADCRVDEAPPAEASCTAPEAAAGPAAGRARLQRLRRALKYIRHPERFFFYLGLKGHFKFIPDEYYVRFCYRILMGKRLELDPPRTFNEKLQWLKLYDRRPEQTRWVDKYEARKYIAATAGEEHLFPLLGVWDRAEEVDFGKLPDRFVLKCTHDSGGAIFCRDKRRFDEAAARRKLAAGLKRNYYWAGREWAYQHVRPRVIAEPLMVDESGTELKDYKFFCFDGEPRLIQVDFDRFGNHRRNLYDLEWRVQPFKILYPTDPGRVIPRPRQLAAALDFVRRITPKTPFMRTDLYLIGDRIYFGEFTLHHGGGTERFTPASYDDLLGTWLRLPESAAAAGRPANASMSRA